ncbi:UNVERIFIED_CONTAM: hypothetical protein GTU68_025673 [Idotea baltica]|nr:hypothetical protein [Idotea baltica]
MGNGETLRPGQFQRISAGTGIEHSEFNPSADEETHFYQIWLLPHSEGLRPGYEQKEFAPEEQVNKWRLVASPDGQEGSLSIQQNAKLYLSSIKASQEVKYELELNRHAWVQVLRGSLEIDGIPISAGDGAAIEGVRAFSLNAKTDSECMLFDLA